MLAFDLQRVYFIFVYVCIHARGWPWRQEESWNYLIDSCEPPAMSVRNWTQVSCKKKEAWPSALYNLLLFKQSISLWSPGWPQPLSAGSLSAQATVPSYPWLSHLSVSNYWCDIHSWPVPWHLVLLTGTNPFLYFWTLWLIPLIIDSPELCLFRLLIQLNLIMSYAQVAIRALNYNDLKPTKSTLTPPWLNGFLPLC